MLHPRGASEAALNSGAGLPQFLPITTPRLTLRRLRDSDRTALVAYRNDPEVARFQSWSSYDDAAAAVLIVDQQSAEPGRPGTWFQFAIERRDDGALVGDCGLRTDVADSRRGEVGFTIARAHQRQGYASEAVAGLLDRAFGAWAFESIRAITDVLNAPSIALLEGLGFRREDAANRITWFKGRWSDEHTYEITAIEWRARAAPQSGQPPGRAPGESGIS